MKNIYRAMLLALILCTFSLCAVAGNASVSYAEFEKLAAVEGLAFHYYGAFPVK